MEIYPPVEGQFRSNPIHDIVSDRSAAGEPAFIVLTGTTRSPSGTKIGGLPVCLRKKKSIAAPSSRVLSG